MAIRHIYLAPEGDPVTGCQLVNLFISKYIIRLNNQVTLASEKIKCRKVSKLAGNVKMRWYFSFELSKLLNW